MTPLVNSILANTVISLISLIGAITIISKQLKSKRTIPILVSFAAGVMLGATFFDILPEAFEQTSSLSLVFSYILIGIVVSFLMERFLLWYHHHHEVTHRIKPSAFLVLFGDAIHNAVDGIAITAAFLVSPAIGFSTALAIIAHEIPQELADFSILVNAGFKKNKALALNLLTALTAIASAVLSYFFLSSFENLVPIALSITAGMFIYIALADLVPDLHHKESLSLTAAQSLPFVLGILIMYFITRTIVHTDTHQREMIRDDYIVSDEGNTTP